MGSRRDKKKRHRITVKGHGAFMCDPHELESILEGMNEEEPAEIVVEDVWMTDDDFNRLPDFQGF